MSFSPAHRGADDTADFYTPMSSPIPLMDASFSSSASPSPSSPCFANAAAATATSLSSSALASPASSSVLITSPTPSTFSTISTISSGTFASPPTSAATLLSDGSVAGTPVDAPVVTGRPGVSSISNGKRGPGRPRKGREDEKPKPWQLKGAERKNYKDGVDKGERLDIWGREIVERDEEEPAVGNSEGISPPTSQNSNGSSNEKARKTTGLFYDTRCLLHSCNYAHVENPNRIKLTHEMLLEQGLLPQCVVFTGQKDVCAEGKVARERVKAVQDEANCAVAKTSLSNQQKLTDAQRSEDALVSSMGSLTIDSAGPVAATATDTAAPVTPEGQVQGTNSPPMIKLNGEGRVLSVSLSSPFTPVTVKQEVVAGSTEEEKAKDNVLTAETGTTDGISATATARAGEDSLVAEVPLVSKEILLLTHSPAYVDQLVATATSTFPPDEPDSEAEDDATVYSGCIYLDADTYVNRHSLVATNVAVGGLIAICDKVVTGQLTNGFALIRPPGHHADMVNPQGFCLYNNVAVACNYMRHKHPATVKKVLIVDWDVHHGNGTQAFFWNDPDVLFFSIHRHQGGKFYPFSGGAADCGGPQALGSTVNMPLPVKGVGDPEYLDVWQKLLLPIAREFSPDLTIISAGFDCAMGDPLGENEVSSEGFAHLTHQLMHIYPPQEGGQEQQWGKKNRVVMALEGGYNCSAVASAVTSCVRTLLGHPLPLLPDPLRHYSKRDAVKREARSLRCAEALREVIGIQAKWWRCLKQQQQHEQGQILRRSPLQSPRKVKSNPFSVISLGETTAQLRVDAEDDGERLEQSSALRIPQTEKKRGRPPGTGHKQLAAAAAAAEVAASAAALSSSLSLGTSLDLSALSAALPDD